MNVKGHVDWSRTDSADGHRTYKIVWLCVTDDETDGPDAAANATGLPAVGAAWSYGGSDASALRTPEAAVRPILRKEPGFWWTVEHTFTTITAENTRCQDESITNPLMEPAKVGGSFVSYTQEAVVDREGVPIKSSSHEMFRGAAVEFDANRPTVSITLNTGTLPTAMFSGMVDTVNDSAMWGLPARSVKLSGVSWEKLYYGTCTAYYKITYNFDISNDEDELGFDRKIIDEGTKVLSEGGDPSLPEDFEVYKDVNGENTRVLLDGAGAPLTDIEEPVEILVEYYKESNLLSLGIPSSL